MFEEIFFAVTEICQLLVENAESGPAAHVKAIEEVCNSLDGASDQLYIFSVHPVSLKQTQVEQSNRSILIKLEL